MWEIPGLGIKPVSPALAGGFLSTVPPGKSLRPLFLMLFLYGAEGGWSVSLTLPVESLTSSLGLRPRSDCPSCPPALMVLGKD